MSVLYNSGNFTGVSGHSNSDIGPILTTTQLIRWIATGGTLSMASNNDGVRGKPSADRLFSYFPEMIENVRTRVLFGGGIDSSQILTVDIDLMINTVGQYLKLGETPLITHGTDSLATTGMIMSQVFPNDLVILTGALKPIGDEGTDATGNVRTAFLIAQEKSNPNIPKVPYVVMNGKVYLASSLVKLDCEYENGRRGFQSYREPAGVLKENKIQWDEKFLKTIENERKVPLQNMLFVRNALHEQAMLNQFKLAPIEIGFANQHTPELYLHSMVDRLEKKKSLGLVLSGELGNQGVLIRIIELASRGFPVFVEKVSSSLEERSELINIPSGMEPNQVWNKLSVFAGKVQAASLPVILKSNIAGEISDAPIREDLQSEFVPDNFYTRNMHRGFLIYFQNADLFRETLISEILRLYEFSRKGTQAELVIEGLGNGHVYLGGQYEKQSRSEFKTDLEKQLYEADTVLNILKIAMSHQIGIKIIAAPRDSVPDAHYEVGRTLQEAGAVFSKRKGRSDLKKESKE